MKSTSLHINRRGFIRTTTAIAAAIAGLFNPGPMAAAEGEAAKAAAAIDWPTFLARHDLVWDRMPTDWLEGAFLGNGLHGTMIYGERSPKAGDSKDTDEVEGIRFDVGRSDVTDGGKDALPQANSSAQYLRVPIGRFVLVPAGRIENVMIRLDLWNAEARGELQTSKGAISWRALVHAEREITVVDFETKGTEAESAIELRLDPVEKAPREVVVVRDSPAGKDIRIARRAHLDGSEVVVAWKIVTVSATHRRLFFAAGNVPDKRLISYDDPHPERSAKEEALAYVTAASSEKFESLLAGHRAWWRRFYPQSFLSVPDPRIEGYYWIQLYKMASGTRPGRPALDLVGPWSRATIYASFVWDLNVQLTYWPHWVANHLEFSESLFRILERSTTRSKTFHGSTAGVPAHSNYVWDGQECPAGHACSAYLVWACHNLYLTYRYSMDRRMLCDRIYPLLKLAVAGQFEKIEKADDGRWHLKDCDLPEYRGQRPFRDSNFELSLLRWGCRTLLEICLQNGIEDPQIPAWKEALEKLADYPVDGNGYRIDARNPLDQGHRHYSHLLMIYPLYLVTWDQKENRELIRRSVTHWLSVPPDHKGRTGYTYTGAASMFASMGDGNQALSYLTQFMDGVSRRQWPIVHPNTMYRELGPCIETPLSFARSVQDMLMQSWGHAIRVFPAVPDSWSEVSFHHLRAEGAFLVSAIRKNGLTRAVQVHSLAGGKCRIVTDIPRPVRVATGADGEPREISSGIGEAIEVPLRANETAVLYHDEADQRFTIGPVQGPAGSYNCFGLNRRFIKK